MKSLSRNLNGIHQKNLKNQIDINNELTYLKT